MMQWPFPRTALIAATLSCLCIAVPRAEAQEQSPVGLWERLDDSGKPSGWFIVTEHNGTYEGTIAKMFMKPGEDPNPRCDDCRGDQKGAPWLGLTIIKGMQRKGLDFKNGSILDPRNGDVWHAEMQLSPDGQDLTVRGCLSFACALLGQNQHWRRLPDSDVAQLDPKIQKLLPPSMKPKTSGQGGPR